MVPFNDLRRQHRLLRKPIEAALQRVLERGWFILGDEGRCFEQEFAAYCGAAHAVGVASGTEALYVALAALGVGVNDEVITVPNTCVPTVAAIVMTGARPVLVDVDPVSRTMDASRLEEVLTPRTKAIVPVHLYGQPADVESILTVATPNGIPVVEDAAQAHGATIGRRRAGTLGVMGCFSFYPTKNLGAIGDGGMIVTNDPVLAERARLLRNYGQREQHRSEGPGINSRLDELQAAVLRVKLPYLEEWNERRRQIADRYREGLRDRPVGVPRRVAGTESVCHLFAVEVPDRAAFRELCAAQGVETAVHYPTPIHLQPAYGWLGYRSGDFPVAEHLCRAVVSLPLFPQLVDDEVDLVVRCARNAP